MTLLTNPNLKPPEISRVLVPVCAVTLLVTAQESSSGPGTLKTSYRTVSKTRNFLCLASLFGPLVTGPANFAVRLHDYTNKM